ncbi:acetoacetate metabolism transcriptional regulator AtoC [Microvirga sp. W0021]|uniref:Acetoacetate metabolism transcriptional regulator AtoC n=1 Tax=Hohaiivirga grylli TaxID=3133970 RepID=A0ABV0BIS4_9HYPH
MSSKDCSVLVVDDEENVRRLLSAVLTREGYNVETANDGKAGLARFSELVPDIVLMDIRMPELSGIDALREMRAIRPDATVILMTAYASVETAVEAIKQGAYDYIIKPFDLEEVKLLIDRAMQMRSMKQEINLLHRELSNTFQWGRFLTNNPKMMELCRDTAKIAQSMATVLVTGESGTGKELIARAIHYNSPRARGPFIKINCGALPETLLESELFGYEKGAFTGAQVRKIGLFERAHEGTLLLDEVGEMSQNLQVKLLRVIQEREFERVGGTETIKADIRLIASTNRDLAAMVEEKTFRQDLYYRLNVIHLQTLPLRERPEDIELLANHFLQHFCDQNNREISGLDPVALKLMQAYSWPGNVRELANAMERAVIMSLGNMIFPDDLPTQIAENDDRYLEADLEEDASDDIALDAIDTDEASLKDSMKEYEKELIRKALQRSGGSRIKAAQQLGISRRSLMYKLQEYRID